jgi:predicted transcriptional regulator
MKAVMISTQPKWCELIASGKKTVEIRKTRPKLETPFKVYIYCTGGPPYLNSHNGYCYLEERDVLGYRGTGLYCRLNNRVIGEFVCYDIAKILNFITHFGVEGRPESELNTIARASCLDYMDMLGYLGTEKDGYAWHISDLKIYDHPKKLSEFCSYDARLSIDENGFLMPTHAITRPPQSWCYVEGGVAG